jgi:hypothetical protein
MVPGRTVRVLPAAGTTTTADPVAAPTVPDPTTVQQPAPPAGDAQAVYPWILACALLALSTLVSATRWWQLARRAAKPAPPAASESREPKLFASLVAACRAGEAARAESLLLAWAQVLLPEHRPRTLGDFARQVADPLFDSALRALLESRYGSSPRRWDGSDLEAVLGRLRSSLPRASRPASLPLPPLYREAPEALRN